MVIQPHTIISSGFMAILRNTLNFINYSGKWHQHFRLYEKMWMSQKMTIHKEYIHSKIRKKYSLLKICTMINVFRSFASLFSLTTAWKVSIFRVFLDCIFLHSDWIQSISIQYLVRMQENVDQKKSEWRHFSHSE